MGNNKSLTATYEELPKIAKIILQLFLGAFVSPIYRILRYLETKQTATLIAFVVCLVGGMFIFWWVDLITIILNDKISLFAD